MNNPPMTSMFTGAHHFSFQGNNSFNNAGRDVVNHISVGEQREVGISALRNHVATSAVLDAEARYPPPLCHPGTREAILDDLKRWADPRSPMDDSNRICWLYGPAGAGKSAIAQTFAEHCAKEGTLAAAFFFWRTDLSRNNPERLFTTIAYQLALSMPNLCTHINSAVSHDTLVLTSSIEIQFSKLILRPYLLALVHQELLENHVRSARLSRPQLGSSRRVLIIDGLDECSDSRNQQRILSILGKAMKQHPLPFQILVASRPEPRIKQGFCDTDMKSLCHWMGLDDNYQASCDIRRFLQDGFRDILHRHSHSMEHILCPWPTPDQIEQLVQKASGQFIYPSTVLKYIDDDFAVPADRLDIVLGLQPVQGNRSPFAELDALYHQILSTSDNPARLIHVLGAVYVIRERKPQPFELSSIIAGLSGIPIGALRAIFFGVHSLFKGPSPVDSNFEFTHASFPDFLFDQNRSLHFFIDKAVAHDHVAQYCLDTLVTKCADDHEDSSVPQLDYARANWSYFCIQASVSDELFKQLKAPNSIYQLVWIKDWSCLNYLGFLPHCLAIILCDISEVWTHFRNKYGVNLKHFEEIITRGFCLISSDKSKRISIHLKLNLLVNNTVHAITTYLRTCLPLAEIRNEKWVVGSL